MKKITNFFYEIEKSHRNIKWNYIYIVLFIAILATLFFTDIMWNVKEYNRPPQRVEYDPVMTISTTTIEFIKTREGFTQKAYLDGKRYSIGYGTDALGRSKIDKVTAEKELKNMVLEKQLIIEKEADKKGVRLSEKQKTALVSLAYNAGEKYAISIIEKEKNGEVIKSDFTKISFANGKYLKGLESRRLEEWNYYKN